MRPLFCMIGCGLLLAGFLGCARRPAAAYQPVAAEASVPAPQLLFLSCRLTAAPAGTQVQVLQAQAVPGDLKAPDPDADVPNNVRVSQLNGQGQPLAQVRVAHPLRRSVEHVADDQRTFQRSEVVVPTAELFVRLALRPTATAIRLEEVVDGKTNLLTEIPIPRKS
ncbi:hypothetical protein [Hymenobacter armeniacus]|uniref:Lipoprotein n=1 Tax=Hymenobacter armeniacus TaxID=2771358 RepID=A0ABR8JSR8_9BACT|nr:hypothetical protein [Hymenobacter armeniacus]MBD2721660.1 hypothetical protein [Hymenobacter armeniacus]